MSQLSDTLHILMCPKPHCYDPAQIVSRQKDVCYYYIEGDIVGISMEDHLLWETLLTKFKTSLNLTTDGEVIEFIKKAITISQELKALVGTSEERFNFIHNLMF